ncbi:MAG: hypothetical protein OEM24_04200 [Paracoccaceae bacterium]|nr:hypothetical protein [Paracoccaceae bacterium]
MPAPLRCATLALALFGVPAAAQQVDYGDDSGQYPRDGECDDRRFRGVAMAGVLDWLSLGKDASDCKMALEAGRAALWGYDEARAATTCSAVKWGDDSSEYALDGVCDDPRFEGLGAAGILYREDSGRDASDCRLLCEYGLLFLRDY